MTKFKMLKLIGGSLLLTMTLAACSNAAKNKNMNMSQNQNQSSQSGTISGQNKNLIYTANESGSISIIDAASYKVIGTIKDEGMPHNVQVSPDGKVVAYTSPVKMAEGQKEDQTMNMSKLGSVVFYDTQTGNIIKRVEVGNHPAHVVFTQDGNNVLVTNNADNNVALLDAKTYSVITNIPVGNGPHGFRISSDSKLAYVANNSEDTISVVDIQNRKEIRKIKVGKAPVTTGITKDGKTLVVTINSENSLAVVDLNNDTVQKIAVGVGPAQVYIEPDDKYAFVANQGTKDNPSNTISKIDMATRQVTATIVTQKGSHGVFVTPDNKYVYVTNMFDNTVSVIDNSTNKVIQTIPVLDEPNGISCK